LDDRVGGLRGKINDLVRRVNKGEEVDLQKELESAPTIT